MAYIAFLENTTMKNLASFTKQTLFIAYCMMSFSCSNYQNNNVRLPEPTIKEGIAKISGGISNLKLSEGEKKVTIEIGVMNPVTGEESKYVTNLNENNRFSLEVPLECSTAIVGFNIGTDTKKFGYAFIGLAQDKELQINIVFDDKGNFKIDAKGGLNLTYDDMMKIPKTIVLFDEHFTWGDYYKMTPKEFAEHELTIGLKERINATIDLLALSERIKKYLIDEFNIRFLKGRLFYYKESAEKSFKMLEKETPSYSDYTAVEPDKSYYSFLRDFNLNNPQYLYSYSYSDFLKKFLSIAAFKIPKIKDIPIDEWLRGVNATVKDVIGFNSGLFYDMLAANAYALQMNDRKEPLTNKQLENISNYFKDNKESYSRILIKKNDELIKSIKESNDLKVNETPSVTKEKLMNTIIAKYKGSVVFVDFWATWCIPCMNAHKDMKPIKDELKDKGVVFVYLTDGSSSKPLWEEKIKGIGGEQYYLTEGEWNFLMDSFSFSGIPTYLIYDKTGQLKHKFTGFPGTDKMREMIEALLH
jgi:thiol-disulfide isomerase/thioredoxin